MALLLVAAIVISLGGTLISLNKLGQVGVDAPGIAGMGTAGKVNLSITTTTGCSVDGNVSFGASGQPSVQTILSSRFKNNAPWTNCAGDDTTGCGVVVNNTGNVNVELNFTLDNSGTTLGLGASATAAYFQYSAINGTDRGTPTEAGCRGGGTLVTAWTNVGTAETIICSNFTYADITDIVTVDYNVTVDTDASPGQKLTLITVTCGIPD
ncbi:MAG: hypothetical protein KKE98_00425 [Nanoarchaeota archaeon]|nr:hypothetical protein [Nanoarchaeota archaeon]MBU2440822.1 hypothetical protein [Nanoarchaeota archaeon]